MDIRKFFSKQPSGSAENKGQTSAAAHSSKADSKAEKQKTVGKKEQKSTDSKSQKSESRSRKRNAEEEKVTSKEEKSASKKRKKKMSISDEEEDVVEVKPSQQISKKTHALSESDSDSEDPMPKRMRKKAGSASKNMKKEAVILVDDSDSDEDPLPRSMRKKGAGRGKKKRKVLDSDSEEEATPPKKTKTQTRRKKKEAVVFDDDSDEEFEKKKKGSLDAFLTHLPAKPKEESKKGDRKEEKKAVNAADFFGGGSVHRVERNMAAHKRPAESSSSSRKGDKEQHEDDDFSRTLDLLDEDEAVGKKEKEQPEEIIIDDSPEKTKVNGGVAGRGSSLSSKLAGRMKTAPAPSQPQADSNSNYKASPSKTESHQEPSPPKSPPPKASPAKPSPAKARATPKKAEAAKTPSKVTPEKPNPHSASKAGTSAGEGTPKLQKRGSGASYQSFLNREGPRNLGAKEVPEGADNCLEGMTFVITGVLEAFERDDMKNIVERYGGKVTGSVSRRTDYLVVGRDAGESKLKKARELGTKQVGEDEVLALIRSKPGKKSKYAIAAEEIIKKEELERKESMKHAASASPSTSKKNQSETRKEEPAAGDGQSKASLLWVDKYKPTAMKQIIGQQGDRSNARKLLQWLKDWHRHRAAGTKPAGRMFGGNDTGAGMRAALLSGPPGVGKTTTATLVAKEAGFSYVEFNASDTRSKRSLKEVVAEALNNTSLVDFMEGGSQTREKDVEGKHHCLIMDEVDGMAGNEDRGGLQELVQLIKGTKIPIICICNDRNHQKMRTLANYCFDLRFQRPRVEQIKAHMMSIAFKEKIKLEPHMLNEIIQAANHDIRQVIHNLCMWSADNKKLDRDQVKVDAKKAQKDLRIGPFDVCRKVFVGGEETAHMTLNDKSDLFFQDYSFGPLFVQENYIHVSPYAAKGNTTRHLSQLAKAAESISQGDLVERVIRSQQRWNLLPIEAMYASVLPGEYMRGNLPQMVNFPAWLGRNSAQNKTHRQVQELRTHMSLQVTGDKRAMVMDYLPALRKTLTEPLVQEGSEGVDSVISTMDQYDIIKEDFDNVMELTKWPNSPDPLSKLDPKTKAAFTRTYNKRNHLIPYATDEGPKKRRVRAAVEDDFFLGEEGEEGAVAAEESEEEEDLPVPKQAKGKGKAAAESSGKGKGKGKGKGRK